MYLQTLLRKYYSKNILWLTFLHGRTNGTTNKWTSFGMIELIRRGIEVDSGGSLAGFCCSKLVVEQNKKRVLFRFIESIELRSSRHGCPC